MLNVQDTSMQCPNNVTHVQMEGVIQAGILGPGSLEIRQIEKEKGEIMSNTGDLIEAEVRGF
jgi:hypothetical protein